ncbi:hypothetical protein COCMIDRAFT_27837 [Bipolaris oryzae ATCC 44560]|uniref:F-box domain-containing protein n=1 Tax=Bipolaris oryzae ATCC 44560 TaxID=930090 RepID=W6YWG3_COCMI|nr:uncharacterized protein COCMIDRAFT_27837 [Bipolaris oryzae ATCC 44560]EUC43707.1 hypothetical protein COCMIDRAFT_27837 [Bipolaris oryzae ATCC 44560]
MVNAKYVAFTVNKQTPFLQTPDQAYATVINCRPPAGKRAAFAHEVRSHNVPLAKVEGSLKRKRGDDGKREYDQAAHSSASYASNALAPLATAPARPLLTQQWQQRKPTRLRRGKVLSKGVDLDCWFIILSYSDPAQLLEMRSKIASCYRFLRDNPMLWKHSRVYYYGTDMPDPPPGLTEFQFAHLRHGHGCMDCGAPNTRKTFWAFLRRMCKDCLTNQVIKEYEAMALLKGPDGEDVSFIRAALPSGIYDSWGNFVGVGPASTHALKTIYLRSDVDKLVAEYNREVRERAHDANESAAWVAAWLAAKAQRIEERQAFAKKMEQWEEMQRTARTAEYSSKKSRRKAYFKEKAAQLSPPIGIKELEACPSYKRAVTIPKDPNNTSWDLLKPKIVKEVAEIAARRSLEDSHPPTASSSGISTPTGSMNGYPHAHLYLGTIMGLPPPDHQHHHHMFH